SQSTTYAEGVASRAVDGNASGDWLGNSVAHTAQERNPSWQVDLQAVTQIERIEIHNRGDCCSERLSNFYVFVSENPFASLDLTPTLQQPGVIAYRVDGQASSPQQIPVGQRGRYVRVQLEAASQLLALAEVEVWAARPSACNAAAYRNAYSTMAFDLLQK